MKPLQKSGQLQYGSGLDIDLRNGRRRSIDLDLAWIYSDNYSPSSTWVCRSYFSRSVCRGLEITTANYDHINKPNNNSSTKSIDPINTVSINDQSASMIKRQEQSLITSPVLNNDGSRHIPSTYDSLSDSCSSSNDGSIRHMNICNSQASISSSADSTCTNHGLITNYINYKLSDNENRVILQSSDAAITGDVMKYSVNSDEKVTDYIGVNVINHQINEDYKHRNHVVNHQSTDDVTKISNEQGTLVNCQINGDSCLNDVTNHHNNVDYIKHDGNQIKGSELLNQQLKNGCLHDQLNDGYLQETKHKHDDYQNHQINGILNDQIDVSNFDNYNEINHGKQRKVHLKINTTEAKMKRVISWSQYLMSPEMINSPKPKPQNYSKYGQSAAEHQPITKPQIMSSEEKMRRATSWSDQCINPTINHVSIISPRPHPLKDGQSEYKRGCKHDYQMQLDMSDLLLGPRFASGTYSRLYCGQYKGFEVAVKILRKVDDDDNVCRLLEKQFRTEVDILSRIRHPNVIQFFGACEKPQVYCIVTEFVANGSLRRYLNNHRPEPMPLRLITDMALDIARGMEYLHSQGIIHRDLKSENLLVTPTLGIKIADFGVARIVSEADQLRRSRLALQKSRSSPNLASPKPTNVIVGDDDGIVAGTYRWMAPEIVSGKQFSRKSDVYSFGIVMWELLTGHVPFETLSPVQAAYRVVHKHERPPLPMNCPGDLAQLIHHCWASDPIKRPDFSEIVEILEEITDNSLANCHDSMPSDPNMTMRKSSSFNHIYRPTNPLLSCFTSCSSTTSRRRFSAL